ncbi:Holliday junction resolvase RecU [Latilactobacillus graminis]|uniref:Holliday junction resolvase RecU n=2 Tax=Latilactobacillus graminis TaxID=60519 RepID=A0AA89I1Z1_9LACO|nr:Holliday junction resolvase RecU [Latilactobacillus graminis]KRM22233.1 recombination protein U [Latilactobacillus graminis DSM 20719]QFP79591.1 Holliday junction resolvase RecU [Latilactobacillus graminis]
MVFHYPNGQPYSNNETKSTKNQAQQLKATTLFGNRGMTLEEELNHSNQYYRLHETAVIYKKPTPIQIVKVDYPARSQAVIKEAYFKQASTTDYNGVYQRRYLDFEAKETKNKTAFPFRNFHQHQIEHFRACLHQGGICFVIMKFVPLQRLFLYPATRLISRWDAQVNGARKSIPLSDVIENGFEIKYQLNPIIPYLDAVDLLLMQQNKGV